MSCPVVLVLLAGFLLLARWGPALAEERSGLGPVQQRNLDVGRASAARLPRSEGDQAIVNGWPLYRTARGQEAYNDAMATLAATEGPAPASAVFRGCRRLACPLTLPPVSRDGWLAPGRLWTSPDSYVVVAHSPRQKNPRSWRRRSASSMRIFVFHAFHNSSRNTDAYDTISSHRSAVFVPLYMSKTGRDARGRRFVVIVQVAPLDVVSIHATNMGSAGPGIEVAQNAAEAVEPAQVEAGVVVATMVKSAYPRFAVVNHRGSEGLEMLRAYDNRLAALASQAQGTPVALPFLAAGPRVASVAVALDNLIARPGVSTRLALAERAVVPRRRAEGAEPDARPVGGTGGGFVATRAEVVAMPRLIGPIRLARRPAAFASPDAAPQLIGPIQPAIRRDRGDKS